VSFDAESASVTCSGLPFSALNGGTIMRMESDTLKHAAVPERKARGKGARKASPRSGPGAWRPDPNRRDPVDIIQEGTEDAIPGLVPIRYGRMSASPFTFYRGTAAIMAADLAGTPNSGINAQLCGDAHLSNFGLFGSPDRALVFDVNDFDETLPGPWEWDLKRLAASFVLAARDNGLGKKAQRELAMRSAAAYRTAIRRAAAADNLDVWYLRIDSDQLLALAPKETQKKGKKRVKKARAKTSDRAVKKLSTVVDGQRKIVHQPPLVVPFGEYFTETARDELLSAVVDFFENYRNSLRSDRRHLLRSYQLVDMALKVVGVGSVGMRNMVALCQGHDEEDLIFLQVKEAGDSALTTYGGLPTSKKPGERVVKGQRLMQATGDIMLGWSSSRRHDFYVRQLWDMKGSFDTSDMTEGELGRYADACGWTLARAHSRSGDRIAIASYLGKGNVFDKALADFGVTYADQAERDYQAFMEAGKSGRIEIDTSANK
jgi:uncharacterized protein (DUF2252 family)